MNIPLVSVVVASYNSKDTILETLESIKSQTYENIELIITDDGSKDGTIEVCKKWLMTNQGKFVRSEVVSSSSNTGISLNLNRGVYKAQGDWVKIIAADDRLLPHCISSNIAFVSNHSRYDIVFSKIVGFGDVDSVAAQKCDWRDCHKIFENFSQKDFMTLLCFRNFLPAASAFLRKKTFDQLGGFDESIPFLEDWPFWIKALGQGFQLGFNNDFTVEYRFSPSSISQQGSANKSLKFRESSMLATKLAHAYLEKISMGAYIYKITTYNHFTYKSFLWKLLHSVNVFNPFYYYKNRLFKRFKEYQA